MPRVEVRDRVLSRALFSRLLAVLDWVPMYHVRRTDRDKNAHPLDNYWYYPLAFAQDRGRGSAEAALASLDDMFQPVKEAWAAVAKAVGEPVRLYECEFTANGFGSEGHPHFDSPRPGPRARHITAVIYCNPQWEIEWAGETVMFDARRDVLAAVLPKPGRMTLIHGDPLHVARGVSRSCPVTRRVLVFKMWSLGR